MCHYYQTLAELPEDFVMGFHPPKPLTDLIGPIVEGLKYGGAYPLSTVPALRIDPKGQLEVFGAEWGLLPSWWKPTDKMPKRPSFQRKTFNARSETAAEKPSFRDAWRKRRCLLPFSEFEEKKHLFGLGYPIAFAGLWESWLGEAGPIETVTLLTTRPNSEVELVGHHRMPCLLTTPEQRQRWLVEGAEDGSSPLFTPFEDGLLRIKRL